MSKKPATAAERRYLNAVAAVPCVLCEVLGQPGVKAEIHHVREGHGMSQRSSHYNVCALCASCHRGDTGLHGDRTLMRIAKLDEMDLLALTTAAVFRQVAA